eukprot:scpid103630/ scgid25827/ 
MTTGQQHKCAHADTFVDAGIDPRKSIYSLQDYWRKVGSQLRKQLLPHDHPAKQQSYLSYTPCAFPQHLLHCRIAPGSRLTTGVACKDAVFGNKRYKWMLNIPVCYLTPNSRLNLKKFSAIEFHTISHSFRFSYPVEFSSLFL